MRVALADNLAARERYARNLSPEAVSWFKGAENGERLPWWLEKELQRGGRIEAAAGERLVSEAFDPEEVVASRNRLFDDLVESMDGYAARRCIEDAVADRLLALPHPTITQQRVANRMHECRRSGVLGVAGESRRVIAWDSKCGCSRLCPDEAREESQRLAERYTPAVRDFIIPGSQWRRVFYGVLTAPNYPRGELAAGKRAMFDRLKEFLKAHPRIRGCIAVQEDPLAADLTWNVHLNVVLLVEGPFNWKDIQREWGSRTWFSQVDPENLEAAFRELVKYSAKAVTTKSSEKRAAGHSEAPGILDWPDWAVDEWSRVQLGEVGVTRRAPMRRVRSYGALNQLAAGRWREASPHRRATWLAAVGKPVTAALEGLTWRQLDQPTREALAAHWAAEGASERPGEPVVWLGSISFDGRAYGVSSIPADNSGTISQNWGLTSTVRATGPPH